MPIEITQVQEQNPDPISVKSTISKAKDDYRKLISEFKEDQRVAAQKGNNKPWIT